MSRNRTLQEELKIWNECVERVKEDKERKSIKELAEGYFKISFKKKKMLIDKQLQI